MLALPRLHASRVTAPARCTGHVWELIFHLALKWSKYDQSRSMGLESGSAIDLGSATSISFALALIYTHILTINKSRVPTGCCWRAKIVMQTVTFRSVKWRVHTV